MSAFDRYDAWLEKPVHDMLVPDDREQVIIDDAVADMELTPQEAEAYDWKAYLAAHWELEKFQAEAEAAYWDAQMEGTS